MTDFDFSDVTGEAVSGRVYAGGFSKLCGKCGATFAARSDRDKYCYDCTKGYGHITRTLERAQLVQRDGYRFYSGLGAYDGSEYIYYHAQLGADYLHADHDIRWDEWLGWAASLRNEELIDVTDAGKYHFGQVLKTMPKRRLEKMFDEKYGWANGTRRLLTPYPVDTDSDESADGRQWLVRLFFNERVLEFQLKPCTCRQTECEHVRGLWSRIQDMYQFTDCPLSDLISNDPSLGTADRRRVIEAGDEMVSRNVRMSEDMAVEYCLARNTIGAVVMDRKREALKKAGIRLKRNKEYGIGCAASQVLINHGVTRGKGDMPGELITLGSASYYGPWMEDVACGHVPSGYEYDLNSAFGAILADMPCMLHGWKHGYGQPGRLKRGHLRIEHAYLRGPGNMPFGPALYREANGHVISPVESSGWHWTHELIEREKNRLIAEQITNEWWEKEPCGCPPPLGWIRELYDLRKGYDKKTVEELIFKKLPDAIYGKFAESGDHATFANLLIASYVTATCRARDLKAIRSHQDGVHGVLKVMSDAFIMRNPHNRPSRLPVGIGLGQWKIKAHTDLCTFAPNGIWWSAEEEKTSGLKPEDMPVLREHADAVFRSWDKTLPGHGNEFPEIRLQIGSRFTSLTQAARTSWADAGQIETGATETRRYEPQRYRDAARIYYDDKFGFFRSYPKDKGESGLESTPYKRHTNWRDDDDMLGFSQHGPVVAKIRKGFTR